MTGAPYLERMDATAFDPADPAAAFRAAMRRVASTVHLVTIRVGETARGMTATAVSPRMSRLGAPNTYPCRTTIFMLLAGIS